MHVLVGSRRTNVFKVIVFSSTFGPPHARKPHTLLPWDDALHWDEIGFTNRAAVAIRQWGWRLLG